LIIGIGAGMYLDATQEPWKVGYQMYSYITSELPKIIESNFPVDPTRQSIMGHSMGGIFFFLPSSLLLSLLLS
jgi:S-formylglutathione hydrolase